MNQKEKARALKFQPVYPSSHEGFPEWYVEAANSTISTGLTFYQSLILSLSKNEHITGKRDQTATSTASYITEVANRVIEEMSKDKEEK